ncbi:MAG: hypothetical protein ABIK31_07525, partial [candidate division WOR-3 bacterium]
MRSSKIYLIILITLPLLLANIAYAGRRYAVDNGNWDQTSTWSTTSGGSPGASVPSSTDTVYIIDKTVTIPNDYNAYCYRLELGDSLNSLSCYLNFNTSATLNVAQDVIILGGNNSSYTRQINVGSGTLNITGKLTFNRGVNDVQINRKTIIQISTGTVNVSGDLYYYNLPNSHPAQCQINITSSGNFNLGGDFIIDYNRGTISPGSTSTFNFNGTSAQTIPIGISEIKYNNLNFSNNGTKTISAPITTSNVTGNIRILGGTLSNNGYSIVGNATKTFEVGNNATFLLLGTTGMVTGFQTKLFGTTSTVIYGGSNQTVSGEPYGHLTLSGTGTKTMPTSTMLIQGNFTMAGTASATCQEQITVNGDVTLGAGTTFNAGSYNHYFKGNFYNNGSTFNAGSSTIYFNGTSTQTIGGSTASTFNNLTINNNAGIILANDETVRGTLTLTNGIVTTNSNKMIIDENGSVSRTNGYINGYLQKYINTGNDVSKTFEVGQTYYSPVDITFNQVNTAGNIIARAIATDHPNVNTSIINNTQTVNRYWMINQDDKIVFDECDIVFNFNENDLDSGADTAIFIVGKYDSPNWTYPNVGNRTSTSTEALAVSSFSDFAIGEPSPGSVTFRQTGIGTDYHFAPILNVDGNLYYFYNLPS